MVGNKGGMTFYSVLVKHECVIMGICLGECAYMWGDMSSVLICRGRWVLMRMAISWVQTCNYDPLIRMSNLLILGCQFIRLHEYLHSWYSIMFTLDKFFEQWGCIGLEAWDWRIENLKMLKTRLRECFMRSDTNHFESLQYIRVVIIKKEENVEPCFDIITIATHSATPKSLTTILKDLSFQDLMDESRSMKFGRYFQCDLDNWC